MTVSNITPVIEYPNTSGVDTFAYAWDMISESTIQAVLNDVIVPAVDVEMVAQIVALDARDMDVGDV